MSTTYFMVVNEKDVEIARTHFNGEKVEVTWVNGLADLLVDEEIVMSDSGNQLCDTVGELRELQVPSDAEVIVKLREELVEAKEDAFQNRCAADHFEDELVDVEKELEEAISEKIVLEDQVHDLIVSRDDVANTNMHFEDELVEKINELKFQKSAMKMQAEIDGQKLAEANSFTDDLKQARKELSDALQESLDREAEYRKDARKHDSLFEDYTEIREMVAGTGSIWASTHGEFLEVLKDTLESLEDNKSNAVHFRNALEVAHDKAAEARKEIRELERKVLTMNDMKIDTENFTVTIFGEMRSDGRGGFFEHKLRGEDFGGGLWFEYDFYNDKYLNDYDGVSFLPPEVVEALAAEGITIDDANV